MPVKKSEIWQSLIQKARALHDAGKSYDEIIKELLSKHNDDALIYAIIKKIKSENYAVKLKEGKKLLLVGSLFMFTGFFITCINFHS